MKKLIYVCVILLGTMLIPSCIDTPRLEAIRFTDDRTIEYEIEFSLGNPSGRDNGYDVKLLSLTPDNGSRIYGRYSGLTKGKLWFTKDIPDGTIVELEFLYANTDDRAFTYSFVKGE